MAITLDHDWLIGLAGIMQKFNTKVKRVPTGLLTYDTERDTREEALRELNKYYPDLGPESDIELYILGWLDREGIRDWRS